MYYMLVSGEELTGEGEGMRRLSAVAVGKPSVEVECVVEGTNYQEILRNYVFRRANMWLRRKRHLLVELGSKTDVAFHQWFCAFSFIEIDACIASLMVFVFSRYNYIGAAFNFAYGE